MKQRNHKEIVGNRRDVKRNGKEYTLCNIHALVLCQAARALHVLDKLERACARASGEAFSSQFVVALGLQNPTLLNVALADARVCPLGQCRWGELPAERAAGWGGRVRTDAQIHLCISADLLRQGVAQTPAQTCACVCPDLSSTCARLT